jgi:hypothetical protein
MKAIISRRSGLEVLKHLERVLTIPSDILMMDDESYNYYLAFKGQMTFNVRNFLV